ncbi:hypothetical protein SVIOM74S_00941 [Streptomyces violarus]
MIGVATAPERRVEVRTQVASLGAVSSSCGRSLMTGTSRVCITATTMPAKASTGTTAPRAPPAGRTVVVCVIEEGLQAGVCSGGAWLRGV